MKNMNAKNDTGIWRVAPKKKYAEYRTNIENTNLRITADKECIIVTFTSGNTRIRKTFESFERAHNFVLHLFKEKKNIHRVNAKLEKMQKQIDNLEE